MLKVLARRGIDAFEQTWDYDAAYLREILDAGGLEPLLAVDGVKKLSSYRKDVPVAPYFAAKLVSVRSADCGACVQLVANMAQRAGVDPFVLRTVLAGEIERLPYDERLAADFAAATLAHDPSADDLRERIVARWGRRGLISIAFAITSAQIFPTLKYALGYGHACVRVRLGNDDVTVPAMSTAS